MFLEGATYSVQTFGCQMNMHDSERICGLLESYGATRVETPEESDIVVFVTCCVREKADTRLEGRISAMKGIPVRPESPFGKRIVCVGGCIGQRDGSQLQDEHPYISVVFGTHNVSSLPPLIEKALRDDSCTCEVVDRGTGFSTDLPSVRERKFAAWLPIMTGCNNFCTYCIVPYVRGRERSRSFDEIVDDARSLVEDGVQEITLLGQNVNSYGRDNYGSPRFAELLHAIDKTGIKRLRFLTSHPKDITDDVIESFAKLESLAPALHLPVQSGSDRILKAMNRVYDKAHYLETVAKLRNACPEIALSTDVIVGFPGETDDDFEETYDLVDEVGYHQVFTFIYSPREGTAAATMEGQVPRDVSQARLDRLVKLVQSRAFELNQSEVGNTVKVLIEGESERDESFLSGRSGKGQTVHAPIPTGMSAGDLVGKFVDVDIEAARTWYLKGNIA